jgi:anion-transporting  ArsA/GET3 family ATPase
MTTVLGGEMLRDVQTFVAALDTMFGGFRERADQTYALLQDPETAFVVVAAPERDALREASFFVERLAQEGMPLAGVVVNRKCRRQRPTSTTSTACAPSARPSVTALILLLLELALDLLAPRDDVGVSQEQGAALPLGHPSPYAELRA